MQDDSAPPEDRAFWDDINKGKVPAEFGGGANDQYFSLIDKSKQAYEAPPAASRAFAGMRADLCAAVYSRVGARVARTSLARACARIKKSSCVCTARRRALAGRVGRLCVCRCRWPGAGAHGDCLSRRVRSNHYYPGVHQSSACPSFPPCFRMWCWKM